MSAPICYDQYGHLLDWQAWSPELAQELAQLEGIVELRLEHWALITSLRVFYEEYKMVPGLRAWLNFLRSRVEWQEYASSLKLHSIFPNMPLRQASRIAGLPRHRECLA